MDGQSIKLELRVWYDDKSRHIKLAGKGLTASTVSNDPSSKRYHPNLYRKLAKALREAGVPAPVVEAAQGYARHGSRAVTDPVEHGRRGGADRDGGAEV